MIQQLEFLISSAKGKEKQRQRAKVRLEPKRNQEEIT
jgi:hypothetical protein